MNKFPRRKLKRHCFRGNIVILVYGRNKTEAIGADNYKEISKIYRDNKKERLWQELQRIIE